jgi:hypothetical protein
MDLDNIDDERLQRIVAAELDRREEEKQRNCLHRRSASTIPGTCWDVKCDDCGKVLTIEDFEKSFADEVEPKEQEQVERFENADL